MTCAAARANSSHIGIFSAAKYMRLRGTGSVVSRGRFQPSAAKGYRSLVRCAPSHGRRRLAPAFAASRSSARCSTRFSAATAHPPRWAVGCSTRPGPLAPSRPLTTGRSDGSPYPVVPDAPVTSAGGVPHHLSPGRPGRLGWWRRGPRRRRSPGPPPRRGGRAARTLPVVAVIPVPVRHVAPGGVPRIARAPVTDGWRRRGRLSGGATDQDQSGQRQRAAHHARNPPRRALHSRHLPRISLGGDPGK